MGIERRISKAPWYSKWLFKSEARRLRIYERSIFDYFETKTIISEQDKEYISHPQKSKIVCIANGIDSSFFEEQKHTAEFDLVFVGNLSYAPNIEAVEYIANQLLPKNIKLTCLISGASARSSVQKTCNSNQQITLQSWVTDIRTTYCRGRIFIAPMMIGTGMQNKLLEAMALGVPCITTSLANNAIKAIHRESIYVANTAIEFQEAIEILTTNNELYQRIAQQGKEFVLKNYNWDITQESKKIGGYTCYKAISITKVTKKELQEYEVEKVKQSKNKTSFFNLEKPKDKKITVWYNPEIPVSHGPNQYWGLPGLIMEVNENNLIILCSKVILNPKDKKSIKAPKNGKVISQNAYDLMEE